MSQLRDLRYPISLIFWIDRVPHSEREVILSNGSLIVMRYQACVFE